MNRDSISSEAKEYVINNFVQFSKESIRIPGDPFENTVIDGYKTKKPSKKFHPDIVNKRSALETEFGHYPLDHENKIIHFKLYKLGEYTGEAFHWNGNQEYIGIDRVVLRAAIWHDYTIEADTELGKFSIPISLIKESLDKIWRITNINSVELYAIPIYRLTNRQKNSQTNNDLITNYC